MLAERDEPLRALRRQMVAVLFVDIVGFIHMAERTPPKRLPVGQYRQKGSPSMTDMLMSSNKSAGLLNQNGERLLVVIGEAKRNSDRGSDGAAVGEEIRRPP